VTGESAAQHVFGQSFWDYKRAHPEQNATFNRALAELRGEERQQIADAYDWTGTKSVLDVGLFDASRFQLGRVLPTAGAFSLVEASVRDW